MPSLSHLNILIKSLWMQKANWASPLSLSKSTQLVSLGHSVSDCNRASGLLMAPHMARIVSSVRHQERDNLGKSLSGHWGSPGTPFMKRRFKVRLPDLI